MTGDGDRGQLSGVGTSCTKMLSEWKGTSLLLLFLEKCGKRSSQKPSTIVLAMGQKGEQLTWTQEGASSSLCEGEGGGALGDILM